MRERLSALFRSRVFWIVIIGVLVGGIAAAAFLSGGDDEEPVAVASTTTGPLAPGDGSSTVPGATTEPSSPSTTTINDPVDLSPINGLPVEDGTLIQRRVLAVKMDNHANARPQSGVNHADMVIELLVEGITRFLTVWHQSDTDYFGPVRSGRPTDPTLLAAFNEPTFAISGAQDWVQSLIRSKEVHLIGEVKPATFRISGRQAPHNLYANTSLYREHADRQGYPDNPPDGPIWEFGPMPDEAEPASAIRIDFSGNIVEWEWDPSSEAWLRTAAGRDSMWQDEDGETGRIAFPVLVALEVEQYTVFPPSGTSGKPLPSSRTTGSGLAYVFADGRLVKGQWQRETETEWFTLTDADGDIIVVPPGKVWISLVPLSGSLTYE